MEFLCARGVRFVGATLDVRAERAVVQTDPDEVPPFTQGDDGPLPRRDIAPPPARRALTEEAVRQRLNAFLRAAQGESATPVEHAPFPVGLLQTLYLEGDVVVMESGREVARADRLFFSAVDDRTVMHGAELHLWTAEPGQRKQRVLVIRGDELVRQGLRTTGRNVSITPCTAGEPHLEVRLGEVEIIQRETDFEVRMRDGSLAFSGNSVLPIPNTSFFARDQSGIPLKGLGGGYSNVDGVRANLDLGGSWNELGSSLHEWVTGRPYHGFKGDWHLGLGWIEERGFPVEGDLAYEAEGLYRGSTTGFYLHDNGVVRREIQTNLDGSRIDNTQRSLVRTENRVHLGENTSLDVTVFDATDAAVLPEFYRREYREEERPETDLLLRHAADNRLLTASVRTNLTDFAYADDRSLAPTFTEELPFATFNWFSEPIAELPAETPLLLTSAGSAGYLRHDFSKGVAKVDDDTLRIDEELELAAPFDVGPFGVRPFTAARITHYDQTLTGQSETRWAFTSGVRAATRLERTWSWLDDEGNPEGLRHVMSPAVALLERYGVDADPAELPQYDATDTLVNRTELRFELLNRLQHHAAGAGIQEFLWLDLAQTILPISGRDNDGHALGLFEYELILAPEELWIPIPRLRFVLEGEHDWDQSEERTFNVGTTFGPVLGLDWGLEYRTDENTDGSIRYGTGTTLFERWALSATSQYDLETEQTINYVVRMVRGDHDWRLHVGATFDTVDDETTFFVDFEPTVGGLLQRRNPHYVSGSVLDPGSWGY